MRALEREFKRKGIELNRAQERSRDRELNREHLKGNP